MSNNYQCRSNYFKVTNDPVTTKDAMFENINENQRFRMGLQHNSQQVKNLLMKRYRGFVKNSDCSSNKVGQVVFNHGYACTGTIQPVLKR